MYLARSPSLAQVTMALATCPPGLNSFAFEGHFPAVGGETREQNQGVGGV